MEFTVKIRKVAGGWSVSVSDGVIETSTRTAGNPLDEARDLLKRAGCDVTEER